MLVVILSLLENLFKWMTRTLGNLKIVMHLSMRSTALHFEHLYPHFSIFSGAMKFSRQSSTLGEPILDFGIWMDRSIKLSKVRLWCPHFWHSILLHNYPSKRSVIMELSLSLKYRYQISDCSIIGFDSQSICLYFGFLLTLFSSLCIPSRRKRRNSWASYCPYPENWRATRLTWLLSSEGVRTPPEFFLALRIKS